MSNLNAKEIKRKKKKKEIKEICLVRRRLVKIGFFDILHVFDETFLPRPSRKIFIRLFTQLHVTHTHLYIRFHVLVPQNKTRISTIVSHEISRSLYERRIGEGKGA